MRREKSVTILLVLIASTLMTGFPSCANSESGPVRLYSLPEEIVFADERVPLDHADTEQRISYWYNSFLSRPWQIERWLQRADVIFPLVEKELEHRDMPADLKYVAVAESDLDARAVSSDGAAGIWQFTEWTAKDFDLEANRFVDERYDYEASTKAALHYLEQAREAADTWTLACASFNLGITGVTDRIQRQNSSDYWSMVFPAETEDYIPRIIAIKIIMEDASDLGFSSPDRTAPLKTIELETGDQPLYIEDLAEAVDLTFREMWLRNPQIMKPYIAPGSYRFHVPDRPNISAEAIKTSLAEKRYVREVYSLQAGEDLDSAAEELGISRDELETFNDVESSGDLTAGDELIYWRAKDSD
ncbi:MAG: transglycosylase SLT domain-containing protein [Spirochaetota bacterium]